MGFVAAACGPEIFSGQLELQEKMYVPPHPAASMMSEEQLKNVVGAVPTLIQNGGRDAEEQHMQVVQAVNQDL